MYCNIDELKKSSLTSKWGLRRCFMYEAEMETTIQLSYHHHLPRHLILIQTMVGKVTLE
ncbi:MAG: hypothetical protein WC699_12935 [Bacteroidales bacterium]|jgi:hypothetical protein